MDNDKMLSELAKRVKARPDFMGHALEAFASSEGLSDAGLADWLQCTPNALSQIALCLLPQSDRAEFRSQVEAIAKIGGVMPTRLLQLLRIVETRAAIQGAKQSNQSGLRMAARRADKRRASKGDNS
jgi:hypothetical protein